jgi:DNA-binding PadR family transcriptional regulator
MAGSSTRHALVDVTVLAFLSQRSRHPYELHRVLVDTHKDFVTGLPRSLYHSIDRLARDDLIEPVETSRQGRRPERTVYQVTEEGTAELTSRLCRMLERPDRDHTVLLAAVSLLGCLSPGAVERSLRARMAALDGAIVAADASLSGLRTSGLPRVLLLEVECERTLLTAELEWVRGLLADLTSGEITWPVAEKEGQPTIDDH